MGAVYLAADTKLNREVAIKVLPDALSDDPDYLARFTREAQVLASLNHPKIATIHGVEDRALGGARTIPSSAPSRQLITFQPPGSRLMVMSRVAD
jgi:serine/threonine protein kinase